MPFQLYNRTVAYIEPLAFLAVAIYGAFLILVELLTFRIPPAEALSKEKLYSRIFSKLWLRLNTTIVAGEAETALPSLVASASGTVLELGPGSGNQLSRYDISKVSKIYGVEPNIGLHPALRQTIKKCGLADLYTIIPGGIEDHEVLSKNGIEPHSIDTVMTVSVLCSVPQPKKVAQELHELLKPGGRMVVYEHVRSEDAISKVVQGFYNMVWPLALGNCHLNRPTGQYLREAGCWERVELEEPRKEDGWQLFPKVLGQMVK